ncbi:septal ring factor EnvC (AmiA/AmiB activator) [Phycicoccus duodecadis]|uniref:Septal ring factor EnvC (AmiA/AmiB activator) n=2 Tax=Phycicoccus duodecadis TaxID=173053 RepID=A0A2N3YJS4_9MICO|nr:septal ring factor EnvC (AmiA/AmiB activator) [Phycicoccus duodecadis]
MVLGSALPAPATPDPGAQKKLVDQRIDSLKNHLDDTSAALATAYKNLKATQDKLPAARSVLAKAQATAQAADQAKAAAAQQLQVAQANEAKARSDLEKATDEVAAGRKRIAQFAAQIYQEQGFGQLDVALSSTEPQQFADRLAMVDTVLDVQSSTMDRLTTERANLTALEDHLTALRVDSDRKKKAAEAALARATQAQAAAAKAQADLQALAGSQQRAATAYEDQVAADKAQLSSMRVEQARLKKVLAERAARARARAAAAAKARAAAEARRRAAEAAKGHHSSGGSSGGSTGGSSDGSTGGSSGGSSTSTGYLSRPVRTGWVSSEFGMRLHPIYHVWRLHSGMDFAVDCGTPVYAAAPGTIIQAGYTYSYGNRIVIDHGLVDGVGLASTYNHLSRIIAGGSVGRGELIGYSGTTGDSTGCHLHFEVLENGDFVNPRKWL